MTGGWVEPSWISQFGPMQLELAVDGIVLLGPLVLIVALAGTLLILTVPAEYKSNKFMACSIFGSGGLNNKSGTGCSIVVEWRLADC